MNATVTLTASALGRRILQQPGEFVRLVLLEAARFGMPGQLVATLDELAASFGLYAAPPMSQTTFLGGPIVAWSGGHGMPTMERMPEIEALAYAQRAEVAFGVTLGAMIGPADIVCALNNCIAESKSEDIALVPPEYRKVYQWAAAKVRAELENMTPEEAARQLRFEFVPDADVLMPRGPLYATYVEVAQNIRRSAMAAIAPEKSPKAIAARVGDDVLRAIAKEIVQISPDGTSQSDKAKMVAQLEEVAESIRKSINAYRKLLVVEQPVAP
jgi:hypothetical protein